jgi:hypothetical protein
MYKDNLFMIDQKNRPARRNAPREAWVLLALIVVFIFLEVML